MPLPTRHFRTLRRAALPVLLAGCALALAAWQWRRWQRDPAVPLLVDRPGSSWIVAGEPFRLTCRELGAYQATFRTTFDAPPGSGPLELEVEALRLGAILLDGELVCEPRTELESWKEPVRANLRPRLRPGRRELSVHVYNENGPPAVRAACPALGLGTDATWEVSLDGASWSRARPAAALPRPEVASSFPSSLVALRTYALPLGVLFVLVAMLSWGLARGGSAAAIGRRWLTPGRVRWGVLLAWVALGWNNVLELPDHIGFEVPAHLAYVRYLARWWTIPLASEGWQMFQSPLYYLLCVPLDLLLQALFDPFTGDRLLRIVSLASGATQAQLAYAACRRVFPARGDLQILGTLVGGLLPMNLYVSQTAGNEPLAGALTAAALVLAIDLAIAPGRVREPWFLARWGLVIGLACLAKVTAALLVPVIAVTVLWAARRASPSALQGAWRGLLAGTVIGGTAAFTCGWYYARNWIALGKPFIGGWDPGRGIVWWQDPGYRTAAQLVSFGAALVQPVYASSVSFLDGLYSTFWADGYLSAVTTFEHRPPWNESLMAATVVLALLPTAAMLLGAARSLLPATTLPRAPLILATAAVAVHVAALLHLFVALPVYSTVKATYTAGLTPAYAVLAAAGLELLTRSAAPRALLHGALACFLACAYGAYFIL